MDVPPDDEATSSWNESRRLIISQLRSMDESLKELSNKIELQNEKGRDRINLVEAQIGTQMTDIKVRISMLEVRAKIWGGMVGFVGGGAAALIVDILANKVAK